MNRDVTTFAAAGTMRGQSTQFPPDPLPAFLPVALKLGPAFTSLLGGLFGKGHADDAVDAAEEEWLRTFVIPAASELDPTQNFASPLRWQDVLTKINAIDTSRSPISSARASELLARGNQLEQQLCSAFSEQGFPCGGTPGTGAGADLPRLWPPLRSKLSEAASRSLLGGNVTATISTLAKEISKPGNLILLGFALIGLVVLRRLS